MREGRLAGKTVAIFGAAGQIGRAVSTSLAREGARLLLADVDESSIKEMIPGLNFGFEHAADAVDVTSQSEVRSFFERRSRDLDIDVVINLVGIGVFEPFLDRTFDEFMSVVQVNLGGSFTTTVEAARIWMRRGYGVIINTGSIYGLVSSDSRIYGDTPRLNSEAYSASKAGVLQLTRYFAAHLAPYGIRVNAVSPGGVLREQGSDFVASYSSKVPLGRMADESDIPGAFIFLASDESNYVNGHNLVVDGGFSSW